MKTEEEAYTDYHLHIASCPSCKTAGGDEPDLSKLCARGKELFQTWEDLLDEFLITDEMIKRLEANPNKAPDVYVPEDDDL